MRLPKIVLTVAVAVAAAGMTVLTAAPASAGGVVNCLPDGFASPQVEIIDCVLSATAPTGIHWTGIGVSSGQGTTSMTGTCRVRTDAYTVTATFGPGSQQANASFICSGAV